MTGPSRKNASIRLLGLLFATLLILVSSLGYKAFESQRQPEHSVAPTPPATAKVPTGPQGVLPESGATAKPQGEPSPDSDRTRSALRQIRGRVQKPGGLPIGSAIVSLNRASDPEGASLETDEAGRFTFHAASGDVGRAALWASALGHRVAGGWLQEREGSEIELTLTAGPIVRVRVQSADSKPLAGVLVEQRFAASEPTDSEPRQLYRRDATTKHDGVAALPFLGATGSYRASKDGKLLVDWRESSATEVILTLAESFEAGGAVLSEYQEDGHVRAFANTGDGREFLGQAPVEADSTWGPLQVPVIAGARYSFVLRGGKYLAEEQVGFAPPAEGTRLEIDFSGEKGTFAWFALHTVDGTALTEGEVTLSWGEDLETERVSGSVRPDGAILVVGAKPGYVTGVARSEGFHPSEIEPFLVPEDEPLLHTCRMYPSTSIRGRVVFRDEPVTDFDLHYWTPDGYIAEQVSFRNEPHGEFELEDAVSGDLYLAAFSSAYGGSAKRRVDTSSTQEFELVIDPGGSILGSVLESSSREPIPNASVRLGWLISDGLEHSFEGPLPVSSNGTFELVGASGSELVLRVEAPGYSSSELRGRSSSGSTWDTGPVLLTKAQPLTLRLQGYGDNDPSAFLAMTVGSNKRPWRPFSESGQIVYENAQSGSTAFIVRIPGVPGDLCFGEHLRPGQEWVVDAPVGGDREARIVIEAARREFDPTHHIHLIRSLDKSDFDRRIPMPRDGVAHVSQLHPAIYRVTVTDKDDQTLASGRVDLTTSTVATARLSLNQAEQAVRVVGSAGDPVRGAHVHIAGTRATTNAEGLAFFRIAPFGVQEAWIHHADLGDLVGARLEFPSTRDDPVEVVLDPQLTLEVILKDGDVPLEGILCQVSLADASATLGRAEPTSDTHGRVRWDRLSPGRYLFACSSPSTFFKYATLSPGEPVEVQVRRTGNLTVRSVDAQGTPWPHAEIELDSLTGTGSLSRWVDEGYIDLPAAGARTDARGELYIEGLPHGPYRWTAEASNGAAGSGDFTVLPGQSLVLTVRLDL